MNKKELTEFGNDLLANGKNYAYASLPKFTKQQADFARYLFSEHREIKDPKQSNKVQPEDLAFAFEEIEPEEKPKQNPKIKPKKT